MTDFQSAPGAAVVLYNISWPLYEQLLASQVEVPNPRFAYNQGALQIRVSSYADEVCNRLLDDLVTLLALEWDIECRAAGSTTFKREDRAMGFEPDSCFYVQNADRIAAKKKLDLRIDPPPDLVVQVEITHWGINTLPIFAAVGVPEVWRCDGERIQVLCLIEGSFVEQEQSVAFPMLIAERLTQLLQTSRQMPRTAWLRSVRDWARAQREAGDAAAESGSAPTF